MPRAKSAARQRLEAIAADHESGKIPGAEEVDHTTGTQQEISRIMQRTHDLLRARDFTLEKWSEHWSLQVCATGMLSLGMVSAPLQVSGCQYTRSLSELLDVLKMLVAKHPDLHTEVLDQSCEIDLGRRRASVHAAFETAGIYHGLVRKEVTMLEFAEEEDKVWRVVGLRTMSGDDGGI